MKRYFVPFGICFAFLFSLACNKIKSELFPNIETSIGEVKFRVPVVNETGVEKDFAIASMHINLDSAIRAESNNLFNSSHPHSIRIKSVRLEIPDADEGNNISNFEFVKLSVSGSSESLSTLIATKTIADVPETTLQIEGENVQLKNHFRDNDVQYTLSGKARRQTTKALSVVADIILSLK